MTAFCTGQAEGRSDVRSSSAADDRRGRGRKGGREGREEQAGEQAAKGRCSYEAGRAPRGCVEGGGADLALECATLRLEAHAELVELPLQLLVRVDDDVPVAAVAR